MSTDIHTQDYLIHAVRDEYTDRFLYSMAEEPDRTIAALTNSAVQEVIALADDADNLVIKYSMVQTKATTEPEVLKISLVRSDRGLFIQRLDLASGKVVSDIELPKMQQHGSNDDPVHDTINKCIEVYVETDEYKGLQSEANKTCETQYPHVHCCLTDGLCYSVVLIIRPVVWRCKQAIALTPADVFAPINS